MIILTAVRVGKGQVSQRKGTNICLFSGYLSSTRRSGHVQSSAKNGACTPERESGMGSGGDARSEGEGRGPRIGPDSGSVKSGLGRAHLSFPRHHARHVHIHYLRESSQQSSEVSLLETYFTAKEMVAQRGRVTCSGSHSQRGTAFGGSVPRPSEWSSVHAFPLLLSVLTLRMWACEGHRQSLPPEGTDSSGPWGKLLFCAPAADPGCGPGSPGRGHEEGHVAQAQRRASDGLCHSA